MAADKRHKYLFRIYVWHYSRSEKKERVFTSYNIVSENDARARQKAIDRFQEDHDWIEISFCTIDIIDRVDYFKLEDTDQ